MPAEAQFRAGCGIDPDLKRTAAISLERQAAGRFNLKLTLPVDRNARVAEFDGKIGEMDFAARVAADRDRRGTDGLT